MANGLSQIAIEKLDENKDYEFFNGERLLGVHNW
jgi:hypothetical protein